MRNPSMRAVVAALVGVLALAAIGLPAARAQGTTMTVLYTADLKGKIDPCDCEHDPRGGLARMATYFNGVWDSTTTRLTLDGGDLFGGRSDELRKQTEFVCQQIAGFGYDAIGLGEQDLNYGLGFLRQMMDTYKLPFTNANVRDVKTGKLILPEYLVVERGGVKFGIVSVMDPLNTITTTDGTDADFRVDDPVATLRAVLPALRMSCNTVVLLSHLSEHRTDDLLQAINGIDIAVVGHTYTCYETDRYVNDALTLSAVFEGRTIGRADVKLTSRGRVKSAQVKVTPLGNDVADDKEMAARVAAFKQS